MDTSNILATIKDLEASLSDLDETKVQIEGTIQSLRQLLSNRWLKADPNAAGCEVAPNIKATHPIKKEGVEVLPSDRVHAALAGLSGKFVRSDLVNSANNDGHGQIASGTFAVIFSKMIKRKQIVLVEGEVGQRNAVYMRAEDHKRELEQQALTPSLDLF